MSGIVITANILGYIELADGIRHRRRVHSPAEMAVDEEQLPRGAWLSSQHDQTYGTVFKTPMIRGYGGSARLMHALRDAASPDLDVYQFGVYTGGTMKSLARRIPTFGHMYGCE